MKWNVGDEVVVWPHTNWGYRADNAPSLRKIERITGKFLVLDDASKWSLRGRQWGGSEWHAAHICPATKSERASLRETLAEIEDKNRRKKAKNVIEAFVKSEPSTAALEDVAELCRKQTVAAAIRESGT